MTLPEPVREAIAVFDKSAERTRPNEQTAAWAVLRDHIATLTAERDALAQRCAAAERDAGLWRWTSERAWFVDAAAHAFDLAGTRWEPMDYDADDIKAAIEAAMTEDAAIDAAIHQETP